VFSAAFSASGDVRQGRASPGWTGPRRLRAARMDHHNDELVGSRSPGGPGTQEESVRGGRNPARSGKRMSVLRARSRPTTRSTRSCQSRASADRPEPPGLLGSCSRPTPRRNDPRLYARYFWVRFLLGSCAKNQAYGEALCGADIIVAVGVQGFVEPRSGSGTGARKPRKGRANNGPFGIERRSGCPAQN
jgi:hypothetical protein